MRRGGVLLHLLIAGDEPLQILQRGGGFRADRAQFAGQARDLGVGGGRRRREAIVVWGPFFTSAVEPRVITITASPRGCDVSSSRSARPPTASASPSRTAKL